MLLEEEASLEAFAEVATLLARAEVPGEALQAMALARLMALQKLRGIATGDALRRLVARTLARKYAARFDNATRPFQFALRARAGTDALASMLRAAVELDADTVVVSLDGKCASDTVSPAAFLSKLAEVAPAVVPFARSFYARTSTYLWWGDAGACHRISQGEGCEQGDALAPALFALAVHDALQAAQAELSEGDWLAAFLDDLYITASCPRRSGECRRRGRAPRGGPNQRCQDQGVQGNLAVLGPDVWRADKPLG